MIPDIPWQHTLDTRTKNLQGVFVGGFCVHKSHQKDIPWMLLVAPQPGWWRPPQRLRKSNPWHLGAFFGFRWGYLGLKHLRYTVPTGVDTTGLDLVLVPLTYAIAARAPNYQWSLVWPLSYEEAMRNQLMRVLTGRFHRVFPVFLHHKVFAGLLATKNIDVTLRICHRSLTVCGFGFSCIFPAAPKADGLLPTQPTHNVWGVQGEYMVFICVFGCFWGLLLFGSNFLFVWLNGWILRVALVAPRFASPPPSSVWTMTPRSRWWRKPPGWQGCRCFIPSPTLEVVFQKAIIVWRTFFFWGGACLVEERLLVGFCHLLECYVLRVLVPGTSF